MPRRQLPEPLPPIDVPDVVTETFQRRQRRGVGDLIMHPDAWWTLSDIALVTAYSEGWAYRLVVQPGFPRAHRFLANSHPRWKAGEVMRWLESN